MKFSRSAISRRNFLKGLGATTLSLPILPSLTNPALAQSMNPYKRVVFLVWSHGVSSSLWRPSFMNSYVERDIGNGATLREHSMMDAQLGLYMRDHFDHLRQKITMISGVSQLGTTGHFPPVALAASPKVAKNTPDGKNSEQSYAPDSIDSILGNSPHVYNTAPRMDVLRLGGRSSRNTFSFRNRSPVKNIPQDSAFDILFGEGFGTEDPMSSGPSQETLRNRRKKLVVDRSLERYQKILNSGRLSSEDRHILEQSMEGLYELQASLQARLDDPDDILITNACQEFALGGLDQNEDIATDNINLITQAFACGHTRVAHWAMPSTHNDDAGAHKADNTANKNGNGLYSQFMSRNCKWIAQLLDKMDGIVEGNGQTMLDNSLVLVTSDMSTSIIGSHPGLDAPFLVAGGLGGTFKMGLHLDYHDWTEEGNLEGRADYLQGKKTSKDMFLQGGPPHNELLISLMKGFGLEASEWERDGLPGFGRYECNAAENLCNGGNSQSVQAAYVSYYKEIYENRPGNAPGKELPYFRNGA